MYHEYKTIFTPATNIGWRLKKSSWGNGYATEGVKRCLEYGFNELDLEQIISTFTANNAKSENVMKKIGMLKVGAFNHPKLKDHPEFEKYICYKIPKKEWHKRM